MLSDNLMKRSFGLLFSVLTLSGLSAQDTLPPAGLSWSGYVELYYAFDADQPREQNRPPFFYNHHRHNEVNLNLALVQLKYQHLRSRANLGLMAGTYAQTNLAAEPGLLKNVFEANVGWKISKKSAWWLDVGIMPSHIGFESAIGRNNWTLTRSLCAENSPYYEAGAKLSFTSADERWQGAVLFLNGWQRIQRLPGVQTPSWGTQLTYTATPTFTINWSTYTGLEIPDGVQRRRYFNNLYLLWQPGRWGLTTGLDAGWQQTASITTPAARWFTPVCIGRYAWSKALSVSGRWEYYADDQEVIITTPHGEGFRTQGASVNVDYSPDEHLTLRLEARALWSDRIIYAVDGRQYRDNYGMTGALSYRFGK